MKRLAWIAATVLAAGLLGPCARARADVYDDNPAAASRGQNDFWVFARRSSDGAILVRNFVNGNWTPWSSLGGSWTSGPAAAAYGPSIEVFARGQDGAVWTDALANGAWTGWSSLGGFATSAPAAIARRGTPYLDVAIKGGDNTIYLRTYVPGSDWHPWGGLGGNLTSAPVLDSHTDGIFDVFARGTDGAVYQMAWTGSAWWTAWSRLGGGVYGAPAAVNKQPHDLDLYVRGAGNAVYQNHWDSVNGWTNWFLLDSSPVGSSVAAVSDSASREILFIRNGDEMYAKTWTNPGGWTGWTDFGPIAVPAPPPPPPPPPAEGEVNLLTGISCTPADGLLHVTITVRRVKGRARPRVIRIVFFTRGPNRAVRVDHRAPYGVRIHVNRPPGKFGRVYARVYFRRGGHGRLRHKLVWKRYRVCG